MSVYEKLKALNITLADPATPAAAYVMYAQSGNTIFLSGHLAKNADGSIDAGLLGQDDIAGAYVVRVVNGVVTLMGTARSAEDAAKAAAFARDAEGVKWVVDHVAVK